MNELVTQWRTLRDRIVRGTDDQDTLGALLETGDLIIRGIAILNNDLCGRQLELDNLRAAYDKALSELHYHFGCDATCVRELHLAIHKPREAVAGDLGV